MNKLSVTGTKTAMVDMLQTVFYLVEKEGFFAGGGVALFRHEADAHQYVEQTETIATLRAQNAELREALEGLIYLTESLSGINCDAARRALEETSHATS